jgi:hypothetical protein
MFHLTCFGWLLFRAATLGQIADFTRRIATQFHVDRTGVTLLASLTVWSAMLWIPEVYLANTEDPRSRVLWNRGVGALTCATLLVCLLLFGSGAGRQFLYFQF